MSSNTNNLLGGFSPNDATSILMKKNLWVANTGSGIRLYNEVDSVPVVWQNQICTQTIPDTPPTDFVILNNASIASTFGIEETEISEFQTTLNGSSAFSIAQSAQYPWIFRFTHCKLQPGVEGSFSGTTPCTKINLIANSLPLNYGATWPTRLYRTTSSGELSINGCDVILQTQLPYTFDNGWFVMYGEDSTITLDTPPAVSCYVYRGGFGVTAGPTITNYGAGRILTATSANSANAETNVIFNSSTLTVQNHISTVGNLYVGGNVSLVGGLVKKCRFISATGTLTTSDGGGFIQFTGGPFTVTLPNPTLEINNGLTFFMWQNTTSDITLSTPAGLIIGPSGSNALTKTLVQSTTQTWNLLCDGFNWILFGISTV